tara:strand:+ start:10588 stop:14154 length:3567 start_codon:yes stop_codon:yes gene_type:complete
MIKILDRFILVSTLTFLFAGEAPTVEHNGFQVTTLENEKTLKYSNRGYELKQIDQNGSLYIKPEMEGAGSNVDPGQPYLPTVSTFYAVDPGKTFSLSVTINETEVVQNIDILPLETWEDNAIGNSEKGDVYFQNNVFPAQIATVSEPLVMRGMVMVQVSVTPFQYNPVTKELTIIHDADVELVESGTCDMPFIPSKRSRAFEALYKSLVVNYETLSRDDIEYQRPAILYVLPNNIGNLLSTVEQLMDWKKRVGFDVNYVSSSNVVNNKNNLKNYIEDAYETWDNPPVHVTIVGDASGTYDIPTWSESWSGYNGDGDHPYTTLEGGDQYPEVFIGRISFSTSSHLNTIISKTLNYESDPYMNENWFERACLVGDASTSGISCVITNEHINEILDVVGFEEVNTVYSGSFPSQMVSGINEGVSFFNYRGYYGVSGFDSGDVGNTSNGFMLPVATVITCGTGSFGEGESLTESFIRAGTASNPRGSVVCIGTATLGTHTMFNNLVDMGFYYGALIEDIQSVGGALMYGKMMLYKNYPSNPNSYCDIFTHWNNLMGESSLQMWSEYPEVTTVSHPYAVSVGTNYIDIEVAKDAGFVEDAWVTIYMDDEVFESGYTNSSGFVRLPIASSETGEVLVTVTKKNHYPYQSSFQINDPGVSINVAESGFIIDDSNGNGDMLANGGETFELYLTAKNYGSEDAVNVFGVISSQSSSVTIETSTVIFGDMLSGDSLTGTEPFVITLEEGLQDGADLGMTVTFQDNDENSFNGILEIPVAGNSLQATAVDVLGSADDVLTPGLSSQIKIQLENTGTTNASSISGTITCASPFIQILDNEGSWTTVMSGGSSYNNTDYFELEALEETIPGAIAHLIVSVETSDGYISNTIVELQIGEPTVNDPMGPDSYGYYIYDNEDIGYVLAPTYNWVEIDDREGGPGSHLNSLSDNGNNQDDVETINIPFTFRFYGQEYDEISICSNGWIAMGQTPMESFRNYEIPGVGGPSAMIAVFWDDLKLSNGGRVYTWHDQIEKKFYIEWSGVRTYQNNSTETFQAVLLDPSYYITPTGDGEILLQYKDFNNTSYGSYSWDQIHGNYCSVGIEDHTMTRGLQYTFDDTYHQTSMELGDEKALLITTRGSDIRLDGDLNYDEVIDIYDLMMLVDFNLGYEGQVNPFFGDINGDGMVNVMDLISLIQTIMGYGE